jgi:hypothetical protein
MRCLKIPELKKDISFTDEDNTNSIQKPHTSKLDSLKKLKDSIYETGGSNYNLTTITKNTNLVPNIDFIEKNYIKSAKSTTKTVTKSNN